MPAEMLDIQIGIDRGTKDIQVSVARNWKNISMEIDKGGVEYPDYTGPYSVTPSFYYQQLLETYGKHMTADVLVDSIHVTETENPQGGRTIVIG